MGKYDDDIDVTATISEIQGVSYVSENHQIWEDEYKDADYFIFTVSGFGQAQMNELKDLLDYFGMSAYIDGYPNDDEVIRLN
jgi:hypothetical protein